ncbi:hypothetical protein DXG01_016542 [Tephrocybe rancida]|nr:hypothetical protein DXG01_016542 [Tephrocybe rancida]
MEYHGTSLAEIRKQNPVFELSLTRKRHIRQTLDYIHSAGYLHGNLTEKSFLIRALSRDAQASIIGFEKAKLLPASSSTSAPRDDAPIQLIPSWRELSMKQEHKKVDLLLMTMAQLSQERHKQKAISQKASEAANFAAATNQRARESREEPCAKELTYPRAARLTRQKLRLTQSFRL